ncbi:peptide chain release factor N(5)-glutamine methyltransferase [Candidatus Saccharibacteria bacterium]|nr:peptide chain release factor N(5)-glutamine methyltransferase [Candidatus Saccharibacteria bacterium]
MTVGKFVREYTRTLKEAGVGSARLDCLVLLEDELGCDRAWILAHPEAEIKTEQLKELNKKLARRASHEPLAYIRGFSEFYGRRFKVNKRVLEPRPESETMVNLLCKLVVSHQSLVSSHLKIIDIGTGSGVLAITAKLEIPGAQITATDIDPKCLKVARQNARALGAKVEFIEGDLLQPFLSTNYHLPTTILANLPYVPNHWKINEAAAMEPRIAIFGGKDGLNMYRRLFEQLKDFKGTTLRPKGRTLNGVGFVLTESLPPQHEKLAKIAEHSGYKLQKVQDFIQLFKN